MRKIYERILNWAISPARQSDPEVYHKSLFALHYAMLTVCFATFSFIL